MGILNDILIGATNPKGIMGDYQHASKIFIDNDLALTPRLKFQYHVYFEINHQVFNYAPYIKDKVQSDFGVLAKSVDLPKYTFDSVVKNQYNRKKIMYRALTYDPINIVLHDDNSGIISALWALYYGHYSRDRYTANNSTLRSGATQEPYGMHPYTSPDDMSQNRYGLDRNVMFPFFNKVYIYTFAKRTYNAYELINPKITGWQHGTYAAGEASSAESTMTLSYESVAYSAGNVNSSAETPRGFAQDRYDHLASPITASGGQVSNVFGAGGLLDTTNSMLGNTANGNLISAAVQGYNIVNSLDKVSFESVGNELKNMFMGSLFGSGNSEADFSAGVTQTFIPGRDPQDVEVTAELRSLSGISDALKQFATIESIFK